jgi:hypothetical protein
MPSAVSKPSPLPTELLFNIFDAVHESNDIQSLLSCALLSRGTYHHVKSLLYKNVVIASRESFFAFEDALSGHNAILPCLVSSLSVHLNFDSPFGLTEFHLARLVTLCPNISSISISITGCEPVFAQPLQALGAKDRPAPSLSHRTVKLLTQSHKISSLSISNWSDNAEILLQLLQIWPDISKLSVSGTIPLIPDSIPKSFRFPKLESMSMSVQSSPSVSTLQRLLLNSLETSLKELNLFTEAGSEVAEIFTSSDLASIQSLRISSDDDTVAAVIKKCRSLKTLHLGCNKVPQPLLELLPCTLEAFTVQAKEPLRVADISALSKHCKNLRSISLCPTTGVDSIPIGDPRHLEGIEFHARTQM